MDVVWDVQKDNSLKSATREKKGNAQEEQFHPHLTSQYRRTIPVR